MWAAHDTVLGRDVAIKAQTFDSDGDSRAFDRFQREAQSTAALQHPNVVTIFDIGTDDETTFLVMELLTGPNLETLSPSAARRRRDRWSRWLHKSLQGWRAHGARAVHRDI